MFRSPAVTTVVLVLILATAASEAFKGDVKVVTRSLSKCGRELDLGTCLRMRAVSLLDQALHSPASIVINDFLSLTPDPSALQENDTESTEKEMEKALTANPEVKDEKLDDMIADRMTRYLSSRSLKFTAPADLSEGRYKKDKDDKKKGGMMMVAVMMGGMMIQMMMGKIALLAGKALLVGKMALLLSAIIGLKKLMSGGGESHPQVIYATEGHSSGGGGGGGHGGGWGRSIFEELEDSKTNQLAYRGTSSAPGSSYNPSR